MATKTPAISFDQFTTFGDLLKFLRRRAGLTQRELSIAVGYSDAQISRLEQNQRLPDLATITARFVPALNADDEPVVVKRLMELAAAVRREDAPLPGLPPFKGLHYFDEADAELFFGRETLTAKLFARFVASPSSPHAPRFLAIIGASGSGKSSLVRAGIAPALRWNPHTTSWPLYTLTPTARPLEALVVALGCDRSFADDLARDPRSLHLTLKQVAQKAGTPHTVLVVDQFEETFTLCREEVERLAFINNMLTAAFVPEGPAIVALTLRADFYAYCAPYDNLREALAQHQEYIGPMTSAEMRRTIEEPAKQGGWELEPGLVDLLLNDVGEEPGALPLLSHALLETWQRRQGRRLTLSGYTSSGGVRGAIAETAETVFKDQFSAAQRDIARRIFLRLTELGEDATVSDTRRRAGYDEFIHKPEDAVTVREVLQALADARLIITEKNSAEVAHEALIREWPTLRGWLEENRESLRLQRRLTEAAQTWNEFGRQPGELYRDARLAQAVEWATIHEAEMNALEREFLDASKERAEYEAAEREAQHQRELEAARKLAETESARAESERQRAEEQEQNVARVQTRNRVIAVAAVAALVLAVLATVFGLQSSQNATQAQTNLSAAQIANTQSAANAATAQAANLLADGQRDVALNAEATAQAERDRADEAAVLSFSRELAVQAKLNLTIDPERSILLALAALDQAYTREAENVLHEAISASRVRLTLRGHEGQIYQVTYSPDGKLIATAGEDKTARIWDAVTGQELLNLRHTARVGNVLFSPDSAWLVTGAEDGLVKVWDVASGTELLSFIAVPGAIASFPVALLSIAFSPDGTLLATAANFDSQVKFWDPASGTELFTLSDSSWVDVTSGRDLISTNIAFSPDGTRLAISLIQEEVFDFGRIEIWDIAKRQKVQTLGERLGAYLQMTFTQDGARLAASGPPYGYPAVWDLTSGNLLFALNEDVNRGFTISRDGKLLIGAHGNARTKVWDAETGEELLTLVGHTSLVYDVAISPECTRPPTAPFEWCGSRVASASFDGTIRVWDISPSGGQEWLTVPATDFTLSQDGTRLSTVSIPFYNPDGLSVLVQEWELPAWSGVSTTPIQASGYISAVIRLEPGVQPSVFFDPPTYFFSAEGILAAGFEAGSFRFWDVPAGGNELWLPSCCPYQPDTLLSLSYQNEPRLAIANLKDGTVEIWHPATREKVQSLQVDQIGQFFVAKLSPDGKQLAVGKTDRTIEVWDVVTGQKRLTLPGLQPNLNSNNLWFSPDGRWLVMADCTGVAVVWDAISGEKKHTLTGQRSCSRGIAFSPDGKRLAMLSGEIVVWDFETGQEMLRLEGMNVRRAKNIQFTPDGIRLIAAIAPTPLGHETVRIYLVRLEDLVALAKTRVTRSLTDEECQQYLHMEACP